MLLIKIILGLIGLGIVVIVHELGHFIGARLAGIDVEAFSIGWGKPFLKKKIGSVEYRLGLFPLGGYCKMRGDNDYQVMWENKKNGIEPEPGSFFAVKPWKRIFAIVAGPLFNFIFAITVLGLIWGRGIEIETHENRIVLLSDIDGSIYPSDRGGLKSGDIIVDINGKKILNYRDIWENIALNPDKNLPVTVIRNSEIINLSVQPALDKSGAGKIGVYPWTPPLVQGIRPDSPAEKAGLEPGDCIIGVKLAGGQLEEVPYTVAFLRIFKDITEADFSLEYDRNGTIETAEFRNLAVSGFPDLGIEYPIIRYKTPALSPFGSLTAGCRESVKTLAVSVKSISLLFKKDIDLTQAISGPARITSMVGEIAAGGFSERVDTGLSSALNFLALISIALCLMNLLPLPILDGGMIILYLIEMIKRRPIHPKAISVFQTAGMVIIFGLMLFAVYNDILFFVNR
ncbi:MAG: RIP metalloprotease RseP [Treponema sp.]|jgi:regulator of sigma E protease|nr:RIP metalloprotease RseP [Treponema sp.]